VEGRPLAGLALDEHAAPRAPHDLAHGREPEARALADGLGGHVRVEEPLAHRRVDADARVAHGEPRVGARREVLFAPLARVVGDERAGRFERERAAVGHRVARVGREVQEHLLDLPAVGAHGGEVGFERRLDEDVLAQEAPQHRHHLLHDGRHGEALAPRLARAAEFEELPRERRRRGGGLAHPRELLFEARVVPEVVAEELDRVGDDREVVVEIVRDARREPPARCAQNSGSWVT
jgi:hypothetical protein